MNRVTRAAASSSGKASGGRLAFGARPAGERDVRLEGFVVERDAADGELPAHPFGELHELGNGRDAEPERRVARAPEFPQPVAAQRDGGLTGAGGFERVCCRRDVVCAAVTQTRQREVIAVARQAAPLDRRAQLARQRGHVGGEALRQLEGDERAHLSPASSPGG